MTLMIRWKGTYRMRNGALATVTHMEKIPCILYGGKRGHTWMAWGKDAYGNLHHWDCETGSRAPSGIDEEKPTDIVSRVGSSMRVPVRSAFEPGTKIVEV